MSENFMENDVNNIFDTVLDAFNEADLEINVRIKNVSVGVSGEGVSLKMGRKIKNTNNLGSGDTYNSLPEKIRNDKETNE